MTTKWINTMTLEERIALEQTHLEIYLDTKDLDSNVSDVLSVRDMYIDAHQQNYIYCRRTKQL